MFQSDPLEMANKFKRFVSVYFGLKNETKFLVTILESHLIVASWRTTLPKQNSVTIRKITILTECRCFHEQQHQKRQCQFVYFSIHFCWHQLKKKLMVHFEPMWYLIYLFRKKNLFAITIMIYSSNHKWGRLVTLTCLIWCLKFVINSFCWTNRCSSTQFLVCLTVQVLPRRASKVNLKQLLQCSRSPGTNPRRLNRNFRAGNVADACSFFCRSIT